ncbi:dipeptidyl-peptidase-4 [Dysgonomonas sp. PH5-45]|uniref:S9 family peptidase n=1 Tax=unclassified Dysgonomonas TaxID=2630389 RepID=UPI0024745726|nr:MULTISPECIES: S9 family peptidase [unclassified Dysgonomonas]MDH6353806.1 dipeptidyl-peptidase-4 [Dysgonomonas sp. PH5-45]MDH6386708.1 dipeptidyl-peptidase-4 [Dysgonomonas sp. PH5-37]
MKKLGFLFLLCSLSLGIAAQSVSLKDITGGKYQAKDVEPFVSSADGEFYFQVDKQNSKIIKYAFKSGLAVDTVFDVKKARGCDFDSFEGFLMSPDEKRLLVYRNSESIYRHSFKADYFYYDIRRNLIRPLTENKNKQMVPVFSKDGRMLAFVVDNNIWLAKFDYDTESQITKDGEFGKIINGATDWVYEEEFVTTCLMDFSADNSLLAFVRFDETAVPQYSFPVYGGQLYTSSLSFKYPKAGEVNSKVSCNVFDIESKTIRQMDLPKGKIEYIPRIAFLPEGDQLAIMTLNREQNDFSMFYANARSSVCRLVLHDVSDQYINSDFLSSIRFFDKQFTYIGEKSGYSHLYLYEQTGNLKRALTSGDFDVTALLAIDPVSKTAFYESAEESPLRRAVYKVDLVKGTTTKLSSKTGYNRASFSSNGKYYINRWSDAATPTRITVNDAAGKEIRVLEDNAALKSALASAGLPKREFVTIPVGGETLNAWIIRPVNFDSSKKYPLVMVQYSGPNSQEVLDKYTVDWVEYLATQGFVVAAVDGRGTGARGTNFRKCTYMNLGIKESDDQIAAARYFASQPYIDGNNIAIWGWSYGGYNVLMSMSRDNVFKAGVAIAPVTDWRFYDSVYAERFMRTPQENARGYDNGSPIKLVDKLNGKLLLIHGSADDNVHLQNSMEYTDALIKAEKQIDMFILPDRDHSMRGVTNRTYLYQKVIDFLKQNLQNK